MANNDSLTFDLIAPKGHSTLLKLKYYITPFCPLIAGQN